MNDAKITPSFYDAFNDALKLFTARLGLTSLWFLNSKAYAYFIPFFCFLLVLADEVIIVPKYYLICFFTFFKSLACLVFVKNIMNLTHQKRKTKLPKYVMSQALERLSSYEHAMALHYMAAEDKDQRRNHVHIYTTGIYPRHPLLNTAMKSNGLS